MKNVFLLLFLLSFIVTNAQTKLWDKTVTKDGFMNQLESGNILFKDQNEMSLIDHTNGEAIWTSKVKTNQNPIFFDGVPFMYFEGENYAIIDASTGDIIDQSSEKTEVLDIHYFWNKSRIVVELDRNKKLFILNIDLKDISKSWIVETGEVQKVLFGLASRGSKNAPAIDDNGTMALVDKKHISLIGADGSLKEKMKYNDNLKKVGFNTEKGILYVMEDKKKLHFIDIAKAATNYTIDLKEDDLQLQILNKGDVLAYLQQKICNFVDATTGATLGKYEAKDNINDVYVHQETGNYYLLLKKNITQLDPTTGAVVQSKDVKTEYQRMYDLNGNTIVAGRSRVNQVDLTDISFLYAEPFGFNFPNNYIELGADRLYTSVAMGGQYAINYIDASGQKQWGDTYNTTTTPTLDVIKDGILTINNTSADYINIKDGKSKWKESVKVDPSFTYAVYQEKEMIVFYSDKNLYFFNTADGTLSKSKENYKFKDFDYETQKPLIIINDNSVFLKGSNSVFVTDWSGNIISENHYKKSDNTSGLMKLANVAVTAAAIGSGNADKVLTVYSNGEQVHKGGMVDDLNGTWSYAENAAAARKAKQNSTSSEYPYVFTKLKNGERGLIFIDADTGKERLDVLMDEKAPNYIVDDIDGVLFYLNKNSLIAYDLK